jgi:hypothetical protein
MFYHKDCASPVQLLLPNLVVLGLPVFGGKCLEVSHVTLVPLQQNSVELRTKFYCSTCSEEVDVSEVTAECSRCFEIVELEQMSIFKGHSGIYCKQHADQIAGELPERYERQPLSELVKLVKIKGEQV